MYSSSETISKLTCGCLPPSVLLLTKTTLPPSPSTKR